jgi:hypothetical protein
LAGFESREDSLERQVELLDLDAEVGRDLAQHVRTKAHDLAVLDVFERREGGFRGDRDRPRLLDPVEVLGHCARRHQQGEARHPYWLPHVVPLCSVSPVPQCYGPDGRR